MEAWWASEGTAYALEKQRERIAEFAEAVRETKTARAGKPDSEPEIDRTPKSTRKTA